jgi:hypothetical protein
MITNGGPHPADKWADMTTDTIMELIQVADDADTPEAAAARAAKRNLRPVLFAIFNAHHECVQATERDALMSIECNAAREHAEQKLNVTPHLGVMDEVFAALEATPFAEHFGKPHVREVLRQIVGQHTANAMHIERSWHADQAQGVR